MRKVFAIAALGLLTLAIPALATVPVSDETNIAGGGGGGPRSIECPGTVVWDTGMYDEMTPPTGCSSAYSAGCFVNAINEGGFVTDWRKGATQFIGVPSPDPITHIKVWGRYNTRGYEYHALNPGSMHGFCIKFFEDPWAGGFCPNGQPPSDDLDTGLVYEQYVGPGSFVEEEVFTGVVRNFAYCITLPVPFCMVPDQFYWVSISADFDFTLYTDAYTQWFHRMAGPYTAIFCEPVWKDCSSSPCTVWQEIWRGVNLTCWQGWDTALKLYVNPVQTQACCFGDTSCLDLLPGDCIARGGTPEGAGTCCNAFDCPTAPVGACCVGEECSVVTADECNRLGGRYLGDGTDCGPPNPCVEVPTQQTTWGKIKAGYK